MRIETWRSDNGGEEIHHFAEGEVNTYLFGFNKKLLGKKLYKKVKELVEEEARKHTFFGDV